MYPQRLFLVHCLCEIGYNVVGVFYADRKADEVRRYSGLDELFVGKLPKRQVFGNIFLNLFYNLLFFLKMQLHTSHETVSNASSIK